MLGSGFIRGVSILEYFKSRSVIIKQVSCGPPLVMPWLWDRQPCLWPAWRSKAQDRPEVWQVQSNRKIFFPRVRAFLLCPHCDLSKGHFSLKASGCPGSLTSTQEQLKSQHSAHSPFLIHTPSSILIWSPKQPGTLCRWGRWRWRWLRQE